MAFKLTPNPTFKVKVNLTVPGQEALGQIEVEFRHKRPEEFASWLDSTKGKRLKEVLSEVVVGWNGVTGDDGNLVEFTQERLIELLGNYQTAASEIFDAYVAQLVESRVKN